MRALWQQTIWAPGAIPLLERKYAGPLKWFVFPAFDIAMMIIAFRASYVGIPAIESMYPHPVARIIYIAWGVLAFICLVGAIFPRLWVLEIGGKITLFAVLILYFYALRVAAGDGSGTRDAISVFVLVATFIPALRLWILGSEIRTRTPS